MSTVPPDDDATSGPRRADGAPVIDGAPGADGAHGADDSPATADSRPRSVALLRARAVDRLHAIPLGARMVAILCAVLLLGLTVTGVTALTLLRRNLVAQVDDQLETYAQPLLQRATGDGGRPRWGGDDERLPSDYYAELLDADGVRIDDPITSDTSGAAPRIPDWTLDQVEAAGREPFTTTSTAGDTRWRAVLLPATTPSGAYVLTLAVALPLTGVERTLTTMRTVLVLTGLAVIALGSAAGWMAVRRSLRPLQEMESTAGAIAAGDLTRRVPPGPPSTEVGRLSAALNTMLGHIERAFAARAASEDRMRRFVADASHELRTPLATIRGYGELYRMGALTTPEQVDDTVRRIEESATRMGRLVEDLLALARLDEGRPLHTEPVDLTVVAADALSDLRALDPTRPVRLTTVPPGADLGACVAVGDEDRLRQVLANLTGNVVQHTPAGTAVEIAVGHPSPQWAVVEVRDHGPGIAPEHAGRVFERFYRVDASRTRESGGGAGLGMAIVAAIVDAHHGRVELAPTAGGGTTVRVWLPTSASDADGAVPGTAGAPGRRERTGSDEDGAPEGDPWDDEARDHDLPDGRLRDVDLRDDDPAHDVVEVEPRG